MKKILFLSVGNPILDSFYTITLITITFERLALVTRSLLSNFSFPASFFSAIRIALLTKCLCRLCNGFIVTRKPSFRLKSNTSTYIWKFRNAIGFVASKHPAVLNQQIDTYTCNTHSFIQQCNFLKFKSNTESRTFIHLNN